MKSKLIKLLALVICVPLIMLCGCSKKSKINEVDASVYLEPTATALTYNNTKSKDLELKDLIATEVNPLNVDSFVEIKVKGNNTWIYKMFIDKITFKVYTNNTTDVEMTIKVTITNLAEESDIQNPKDVEFPPVSFIPEKEGSMLCTVDIDKVVAVAAKDCIITFDIYNSTTGTVADNNGAPTDFRWTIYDLSIYGEHRSY